MLSHTRMVVVEWGDCDPAGIVFFPRYFQWFDASTAALFESVGLPKTVMLARFAIMGIPVVDVRARFRRPSSFGDRVVIESRIEKWGRASFEVEHALLRDDAVAVEGYEKRVWVERAPDGTIRSLPLPEEVIALFSGEVS
jgi:4-hydroxybenzoyl-CoA thioesterase